MGRSDEIAKIKSANYVDNQRVYLIGIERHEKRDKNFHFVIIIEIKEFCQRE